MNYKDDPKVKAFYPTEEILKADEGDGGTFDNWFDLLEYDGKYAVDYNYYVDGYDGEVEDYSRFYGCFPDGKGNIVTDGNFYYKGRYQIDFKDPEWKEKLLQAAYEFLINEVLKADEYELWREDYVDKDLFVNEIIKRSKLLDPGDRGLVYDYGKNADLKLYISMDDDYDLRIWVDKWENPEDPDDGSVIEVEESDDYFYSKSEKGIASFIEDLERIWNEDYSIE